MTVDEKTSDEFVRLHRAFSLHFGVAVALSWATSLVAVLHAPWVRNIRPLIDPSSVGQIESTWSFLFAMPIVMSTGWLMALFGRGLLREMQVFKKPAIEFAFAGAAAFFLFYLSVDRAVAVIRLGI